VDNEETGWLTDYHGHPIPIDENIDELVHLLNEMIRRERYPHVPDVDTFEKMVVQQTLGCYARRTGQRLNPEFQTSVDRAEAAIGRCGCPEGSRWLPWKNPVDKLMLDTVSTRV